MRHHLQHFFRGNGAYQPPNPLGRTSGFPGTINLDGMTVESAVGTLGSVYNILASTTNLEGITVESGTGNYSVAVYAILDGQMDFAGITVNSAEGLANDPELVPDSEMNNINLWTVANSGTGIAYAYTLGGTMTVVGDVGAILTITNNGSVVTGLDYDYELKINSSTFTGLGTSIYIGEDRIWRASDGAVTIVPTTITNLGAGDSTAGWMQFRGAGTAVIDYLRIQRTVANTDFFFMDPEQVDIDGMSVLSADGAFVTASLLIFEDNFDGTNTDPLDARTTTGAGSADPLTWTDANSTFEIDTNQLRPIGLDGIATLEDHGQANFILKYHINAQQQGAENNISVVARFKDPYRWIAVDHALDSGGNSYLRVYQASNSSLGAGELLDESGPGTFDFRQGNGGEWVTIIVLSNTLTAYVDSAPANSTLTVDIDSELDAITVVGLFPPRLNPNQIRINDLQMTIFLGTSFTSDAAQIDIDGLSINSADGTFNTVWPPGFNSLPISIDIDGMSILSADGTFDPNPVVWATLVSTSFNIVSESAWKTATPTFLEDRTGGGATNIVTDPTNPAKNCLRLTLTENGRTGSEPAYSFSVPGVVTTSGSRKGAKIVRWTWTELRSGATLSDPFDYGAGEKMMRAVSKNSAGTNIIDFIPSFFGTQTAGNDKINFIVLGAQSTLITVPNGWATGSLDSGSAHPWTDAVWHDMELYIDLGTLDTSDGTYYIKIDGNTIASATNVKLMIDWDGQPYYLTEVWLGGWWSAGTGGPPFPGPNYRYIKDATIEYQMN